MSADRRRRLLAEPQKVVDTSGRRARCEPVTSAGPTPGFAAYEAALAHHARAERPYDRARAQLAYGEFLCRPQRMVDAYSRLRAALSTFDDLGAEPLVARATQELRATGETARKRNPSTLVTQTPMELQVAELVSQGQSQRDLARPALAARPVLTPMAEQQRRRPAERTRRSRCGVT